MTQLTSSSRWQGIFAVLGFGRRQRRRSNPTPKRQTLRFEPLEDRRLLSVLYWDPQQSSGARLGGPGSWTDGGAVWYNPATKTDVAWNNANGDAAVFQGNADTVTVNSGVSVGGIEFDTSGYTLGGAPITLTPNNNAGWLGGQIKTNSTTDAIDAVLAGSVGLTKSGLGTLTLTGKSVYSGGTAIQNGTLELAGGDDRLPTGTTVTLGDAADDTSGVLQLGDGTTARNQTLAGLVNDMDYQYSAGNDRVVGGGSGAATLTLNVAAGDDYEFDGVLGGSSTYQNNLILAMTGPGTEELGALNSYNGGTTLAAGVLQVWNAEALGTGSVTTTGGVLRNLGDYSTTQEHLYYVDPAGVGGTSSNYNDGSIHRPFATLAKAYSVAGPGDTIILRGGTYDQADLGYSFKATGAAGKPLTIEAAPGEHPVLDLAQRLHWQQDSTTGCWYTSLPSTAYPDVEIINGWAATALANSADFFSPDSRYYQNGQLAFDLTWYDTTNQRLWFRSNQIDPVTDPDTQCGYVGSNSQGFAFYGGSWLVIKGLQIQNGFIGIHIGGNTPGGHITIEDCRITHMWDQGILIGGTNIEISNNYVDAIGGQLTLSGGQMRRQPLYHDLYAVGQGFMIHDNFFGRAVTGESIQFVSTYGATLTSVIENNVCYGGQQAGLTLIHGADVVVTGNVIVSPALLWRGSPPQSSYTTAFENGLELEAPQDSSAILVSGNYIEGISGVDCENMSTPITVSTTLPGWVMVGNTMAGQLRDVIWDMFPAEMNLNQGGGTLNFAVAPTPLRWGFSNLNGAQFLTWMQNQGYETVAAGLATSLIDSSAYDPQLDAGLSLAQAMARFRTYATGKVDSFAACPAAAQSSTLGGTATPNVNGTLPQVGNDAWTLTAGTTLTVDAAHGVLVNDSDADNYALTALLVSPPKYGQLTLNADGSLSYTPYANACGTDTFTYLASDGHGGTALATVTLNVTRFDGPIVNVTDAGGTYNGAAFPAAATLTTPGNPPLASLGGISPTLAYYAGSLTTGQLATATALPGAPSAAGTYTVVATFAGNMQYAPASSNPLTFTIVPASTTMAVISPRNPSVFRQAASFTVTMTSSSGMFDNGGSVQFAVDGNNFGAPVTLSGGSATIQDSALGMGIHTITAIYSGDSNFSSSGGTLSGSQTVVGPVSIAQSTVTVAAPSIRAGSALTVTLTARDAFGRQEPNGGLTVAFSLGAGSTGGSFSAVTDNGNGTYTATFTGTKAGSDTINATIWGQVVTSTPPTVTVTAGTVSLTQSTLSISPATVAAGGKTTVTLTARDASGAQLTGGGLTVAFSLGTGTTSGTFSAVKDQGNGTYTATFTGTKVGSDTIKATIGGQVVTSTRPTVTVTPGAVSLSQSTISVNYATIAAGGKTTLTLTARDAYGNQETSGGLTVAFLLATGSTGGTLSAVTDNGNGTYTATFTGTKIGSDSIKAAIGDQFVTSIWPTVTVTAA